MKKLSKEQLRLERSLFQFLTSMEYIQCENLEQAKHNLNILKESGSKEDVENWKFHIKCIKNNLKFIDTQKGQFPISFHI